MRIFKILATITFVLSLSAPSFAQTSSAASASGSAGAAGSTAAASGAAAGAAPGARGASRIRVVSDGFLAIVIVAATMCYSGGATPTPTAAAASGEAVGRR